VKFDHWQRWGVALDDVSFANAWLALGLTTPGSRSVKELHRIRWESEMDWSFPDPAEKIEGAPQEWAQAWVDLQNAMKQPVRLRVVGEPMDEPMLPWYRILREARPEPQAVSLLVRATRAQFNMEWPMHVGSLSEDSWRVLEHIEHKKLWPSSKLARMLQLGREQANCDILLYKGQLKSLIQALLDLPYGIKTNLIIAEGGPADWGEQRALLSTALGLTRASGFALAPSATADETLAELLNQFVAELSHAQPPDVALALAAAKVQPDVIAGFTPEMAQFVLPGLAKRYNARLAALPPDTALDLSTVGPPNEWLARGVDGGGARGGEPKAKMASPDADRIVAASSVHIKAEEMKFGHENEGGAIMAEVGEAMTTASAPPEAQRRRAARFLQQKSFVRADKELIEAKDGFLAGVPAIVRVRIGEPELGWDIAATEVPIEKLPKDLERWNLTVWLSEPDHLPQPLKRQISLPRDGNSTEAEFYFKPRELPRFEGRLTVLHRGRVIQTMMLRAGVVSTRYPAVKDGTPRLAEEVAVRHRIGELDARREFDLALVANHDSKGRPLLAAVSSNAAWVKDLSQLTKIAKEISASFAPVAQSVSDYADGVDGENGRVLLVKLAQHGNWLKTYLSQTLDDPENNPASANVEYIQIVSTRPDAVVPLEFVYDYAVPEDDAKVCKNWRKAVQAGKCPGTCDHDSPKSVCPLGFWGLSKVIERHAVRPGLAKDGNLLYLQSEPTRTSDKLHLGGTSVLGSSKRVPAADIAALEKTLAKHCGTKPKLAKDWDDWEELVKKLHPPLLIALPHTDGRATDVTVEIGGETIKTITLRQTHVFPPPIDQYQAPLVALIGCDVAGTADEYGNHVVVFRDRGAGIVIGTIATVFGKHAAQVAAKLVEGVLPAGEAKPVRLGELIRKVRRDALLANLLMPLCLVAYGDADWILARKPTND
jgi:hypothetical protein